MTIKQWLSRGRGVDQEIDALLKTRRETFDRLTSIAAQTTGDVVMASKDPHKYDRLVELNDLIDRRIDELVGIKAEILTAINQLEDWRHRAVLRSRYVDMKTWEQTAVDMHYSYMQVTRIHGYALIALDELMGKRM